MVSRYINYQTLTSLMTLSSFLVCDLVASCRPVEAMMVAVVVPYTLCQKQELMMTTRRRVCQRRRRRRRRRLKRVASVTGDLQRHQVAVLLAPDPPLTLAPSHNFVSILPSGWLDGSGHEQLPVWQGVRDDVWWQCLCSSMVHPAHNRYINVGTPMTRLYRLCCRSQADSLVSAYVSPSFFGRHPLSSSHIHSLSRSLYSRRARFCSVLLEANC